jgi:hypothetical protein
MADNAKVLSARRRSNQRTWPRLDKILGFRWIRFQVPKPYMEGQSRKCAFVPINRQPKYFYQAIWLEETFSRMGMNTWCDTEHHNDAPDTSGTIS